jgi:hypothetical protein
MWSNAQTALSTLTTLKYNTRALKGFNQDGVFEIRSVSIMLWTILVVLLVLWLIGAIGGFGGNLIHLLLVIALVVLVLNLLRGRRAV